MPIGAQLTVIGKRDECGKLRPRTEVPAHVRDHTGLPVAVSFTLSRALGP